MHANGKSPVTRKVHNVTEACHAKVKHYSWKDIHQGVVYFGLGLGLGFMARVKVSQLVILRGEYSGDITGQPITSSKQRYLHQGLF